MDYIDNLDCLDEKIGQNVLYISSSFEGALFNRLKSLHLPIISDIIVEYCIQNRIVCFVQLELCSYSILNCTIIIFFPFPKTLPLPKHPLFNYFMKDYVICFSINDKRKTVCFLFQSFFQYLIELISLIQNIINKYLNLIRYMNGQSRRDMNTGKSYERTHLIESTTGSVNYQVNFCF